MEEWVAEVVDLALNNLSPRETAQAVLKLEDISKVYGSGELAVHALRSIDLQVYDGEYIAIMGPSGSGKSTLMNIVGCLDTPTAGQYWIDDTEVSRLKDDQLALIRNRAIGFIFQGYNLLPNLTAQENVELPLIYRGVNRSERERLALAALDRVGLADRLTHRPSELSGGQQQRVAIARAITGEPRILLADEPTGNLDSVSEQEILEVFRTLNIQGMTILVVTHDLTVANQCQRLITMHDGSIVGDNVLVGQNQSGGAEL